MNFYKTISEKISGYFFLQPSNLPNQNDCKDIVANNTTPTKITNLAAWPNQQTGIYCALLVINLSNEYLQSSIEVTQLLNFPFRVVSFSKALYQKKYYNVACEMIALTILFCPNSIVPPSSARIAMIAIDTISEFIHPLKNLKNKFAAFLFKPKEDPNIVLKKQIFATLFDKDEDPTNFEYACKWLSLTAEEANDLKNIERQFEELMYRYSVSQRHANESGSNFAIESIAIMIRTTKTAYATLKDRV